MNNIGEHVMQMGNQEYNSYLERCQKLTTSLDQAICLLMHFIFEGRACLQHEWEMLFRVLSQAVFMKHFLSSNRHNLCTISEDFLADLEEWKLHIEDRLK